MSRVVFCVLKYSLQGVDGLALEHLENLIIANSQLILLCVPR